MRRLAWTIMALGLLSCNGDDGAVGLRCSADTNCPGVLVCGSEGRCVEPCSDNSDCPSNQCSFGRCLAPPSDGGPTDASGLDSGTDGGVEMAPCVQDDCQLPPARCEGDVLVVSVQTSECQGASCGFEELRSSCPDCANNCLPVCDTLDCETPAGECGYGFCTASGSSAMCARTDRPDGTPCATGSCQGGVCAACSRDLDCDDQNPCTNNVCNTGSGTCTTTPANGSACEDGDACTVGDMCQSGQCLAGGAKDCSDGNPCTLDVCDAANGACTHPPQGEGSTCDDGNACSTGEVCQTGVCTAGSPVDCGDGNACTDDVCDPVSGCANPNNTESCDDGDLCTHTDRCTAGSCSGTTIACADEVCVNRSCNGTPTCTVSNRAPGIACTPDNSPCTTDACDGAGACAHAPRAAGTVCTTDGNPCTIDRCNGSGACTHPPVTAGTGCTTDGNACTADVCNASGTCTHLGLANGTSCGGTAAFRCCNGACRNISIDVLHCGGCNTACASGLQCEPVSVTTQCSSSPASTSGRCRCQASNAQCPRGQICRTFTPYTDRCTPDQNTDCDSGIAQLINTCPDYCRY